MKKKIFVTYDEKNNGVTVKLSEMDQEKFTSLSSSIYPVKNKWGKQGWTIVKLNEIREELLTKILTR